MEMKEHISNSKGQHCLADFTGIYGDENKIGNFVFDLMIKSIERTTMKIVHKKLQILNLDTPPGFTSFLLLDSSHFSSHSYVNEGLLSCDIYTCGPTNPLEVMTFFYNELLKEFPEMKCVYMKNHKRFHY